MRFPVDNPVITQGYQANKNLFGYGPFGHTGVDLRASIGTPIRAVHTGTVSGVGIDPSYVGGMYVIVSGPGGYKAYTGHMSRIDVKYGQSVSEGQLIGLSGDTGFTTGPHVHFQVRDASGNLVNPLSLITNNQGAEMTTLQVVRILAERVLGRRGAINGACDDDLKKYHVGHPTNDKVVEFETSAEGRAYQARDKAVYDFYNAWTNKVGELSSRPTKVEYDALNAQLKELHLEVADAQAKLEAEQAKPPVEVIKEVPTKPTLKDAVMAIIDWFKNLKR